MTVEAAVPAMREKLPLADSSAILASSTNRSALPTETAPTVVKNCPKRLD
jgi:hypothetical protein